MQQPGTLFCGSGSSDRIIAHRPHLPAAAVVVAKASALSCRYVSLLKISNEKALNESFAGRIQL